MSQQYEYSSQNGTRINPKVVITIGGTPFVPRDYNLVTNKMFENDVLTIHVPMDSIDISSVYLNALDANSFALMEIWAGYVSYEDYQTIWTQSNEEKVKLSNDGIHKTLLQNYQKMLNRRWIGYVTSYDLDYVDAEGTEPDSITIVGSDISKILKDTAFEANFAGDDSRLENVLNIINSHLPSFEITLGKTVSNTVKNLILGYDKKIDKDTGEETEKEIKYNTKGKNYWDVLRDIVNKGRLKLIADYENIHRDKNGKLKIRYTLEPVTNTGKLWKLYRNRDFKTARLRLGDIAVKSTKRVAVKVRSCSTTDPNNPLQVEGTFPRDLNDITNPEEVSYRIIDDSDNLTKEQCEQKALLMAATLAKTDITGETLIPNGIIGIKQSDEIQLFDDDRIGYFKDKQNRLHSIDFSKSGRIPTFEISSITEDFDEHSNSITQKYEFHLVMDMNLLDVKTGKMKGKEAMPQTGSEITGTQNLDAYLRTNAINKETQQGITP